MKIGRSFLLGAVSACAFAVASIYITYPLVFHIADMSLGKVDVALIAWIQNWVIHALGSNPFGLFNANIYYPYNNTLAYSDTHITMSVLAIPLLLLFKQPIAVFNYSVIFSFLIDGLAIYCLCYYLTHDFLSSLFAGLLVEFSPAVISNYLQPQYLNVGFAVFSLLFFIVFLRAKKTVYLMVSVLFFWAQLYNAILPIYFIIFGDSILLLNSIYIEKIGHYEVFRKKNIYILLFGLLLSLPIIFSYYSVSHEFHYVRDLRDSIHFALEPEDLLFASSFSRFSTLLNTLPFNKYSQNNEFKPGFIGGVFTSLSLFAIWISLRNVKKKTYLYSNCFLLIAFLGLIVSLGPFLHLNRQTIHHPFPLPLPYLLFYYLIPGFQSIRNSHMWEMLFVIGFAVSISIVLAKILKNYSLPAKLALYGLLFLGVILEFTPPMRLVTFPQVSQFPPVYAWLQATPVGKKIIEMPIYTWRMQPYVFDENMREYYSTVHFHKMINGASGYSPAPWQDLVTSLLKNFPREIAIDRLRRLGVNYIIVHKREYDNLYAADFIVEEQKIMNGGQTIHELAKNKNIHLIKTFGDDYVFQLQ